MNPFTISKAISLTLVLLFISCSGVKKQGGGFNLFSIQEDIKLGKQVQHEIASKPKEYPLLPEKGNEEAYRYIRKLTNKILNSGQVAYRKEFEWEVKIIKDDKTLNAFCAPGGYIYVYTGLIKYLDSEEQLAGVMGHEIAHAAQRHTTRQLQKTYGIATLISVASAAAGTGSELANIATSVISLQFSRKHEAEADSYSVLYLCPTSYQADGAADFFKKLQSEAGQRPPEFLSTHPDPANRVKDITNFAKEKGCKGNQTYKSEYSRFKKLL